MRSSSSYYLPLAGKAVRVYFLCRTHRRAVLDGFSGGACEHVLQRAQNTDRIEIVVVADVRNTEELALHFALAVRYHGVERLAEFFDDLSGIDSIRRADRSECGCRRS